MWSWILVAGTMLTLMNAWGRSQPLLPAHDQPTHVAQQAAGPVSPFHRLRMQTEQGNVEAQSNSTLVAFTMPPTSQPWTSR